MISVIMSVYKEKKEWLKEAIESILMQTYTDFEFIITLDNPDNIELKEIIQLYQEKDKRIKFIVNDKNMGLVYSLNNMLKIAKGEYVARMDADDISLPNRLQKQLEFLKNKHIDLLGCNTIVFDDNKQYKKYLYEDDMDIKENIGNGSFIPHPTWVVRREVFNELNGYRNINLAEDYDFILRAIKHGFILGNYKEHLLKYRINTNSISRENAYKQKLTSIYLYEHFKEIDDIKIEDLDNCINKKLKNKENYSKGEKVFFKFKQERNLLKKIYLIIVLIFKYSIYLENNKYRNTIEKVKNMLSWKDRQYSLRIKYHIKKYIFPIIKRSKKINLKNEAKTVYLIDVPQFRNLGDHAIAKAERIFFENNYKDYKIIEIPIDEYEINYFSLKKNIKKEDLIVLVGGGNFGVEYFIMELHRRDIIKNFKNKIILFPQTIYFGYNRFGLEQLRKSSKIYSHNKNLIMFAREKRSYNIMQHYFENMSYLVPDIVLSMNIVNNELIRNKVLICLRNDIEGCLHSDDIKNMYELLENYKCEKYDTVIDKNVMLKDRDNELEKSFRKFMTSKLVITDRLHGMIFAAITNTPCIVFKNYNYKVEGVYNAWLKNNIYINFIQDKTKLNEYIDNCINKTYDEVDCHKLDKEFENMNKIIKEFIK